MQDGLFGPSRQFTSARTHSWVGALDRLLPHYEGGGDFQGMHFTSCLLSVQAIPGIMKRTVGRVLGLF
jgi:hypothetical protein